MKIGDINLGNRPVVLAPMEDVTDQAFRLLCKEFGASMVYSEFVSADALIRNVNRSLEKIRVDDRERPVAIQIYGRDVDSMVEAAKVVESEAHPDLLDINFGCPVKKVAGKGAGAGMLRTPQLMLDITREVVKAVRVPVTVKTRLGWDVPSLYSNPFAADGEGTDGQERKAFIVEMAERLQDCGIEALTIHGRTRSQMYQGEADWTLIGEVKANPRMRIPIIGNGDICTAEQAAAAFDRYGVDAVMIGRATFGHPWIFREIKYYLEHGEPMPDLSVGEKVDLAKKHLGLSLEHKGATRGIYEMRRHLSCYFKGLPDFKELRMRMVTTLDAEELYSILELIRERYDR